MTSEQFGHYRLDELIGRGGMGEVHRAFDTDKERHVALKRLPAALAADPEFQARFRKESSLAARLSNPHIIPIHDYGEIDGRLFIDMRLVAGRDLAALLSELGPIEPVRAVGIVGMVAQALDAAHADGLVHRDVKPSNVLVAEMGGADFAYLIDFGISRALAAAGGGGGTSFTITGATVGTLDYMAPERFLDGPLDKRVDVYSLACLLHEILTGTKPFRGEGLPAMIHAHLNLAPPRPSLGSTTVPAALDDVVARGMAKEPAARFATAGALASAARTALDAAPASATGPAAQAEVIPTTFPPTFVPPSRSSGKADLSAPETFVPGVESQSIPGPDQQASTPSPDRLGTAHRGRRGRTWMAVAASVLVALASAVAVAVAAQSASDNGTPQTQPGGTAAVPTTESVPEEPAVTSTIEVGGYVGDLVLSPGGERLYANDSDNSVVVIDTATGERLDTVRVGSDVGGMALTPDGAILFVANSPLGTGSVSIVDTATLSLVASVAVDEGPQDLAVAADGGSVYVTHGPFSGSISVIDVNQQSVTATIPAATFPVNVAVGPRNVYVTDARSAQVSVIDPDLGELITTIAVGQRPVGITFSPDARTGYVTNADDRSVSVFDTATNSVIDTITVGANPTDVAVSPDGSLIYVVCIDSDMPLSIIDDSEGIVVSRIEIGSPDRGLVTSAGVAYVGAAGGVAVVGDGST